MRPTDSAPTAAAICQRIFETSQAQGRAIERGDFESFEQLAQARASLLALLPAQPPVEHRAAALALLQRAAAQDDRNLALARGLMQETGQALGQLRRRQSAAREYGRPASNLMQQPRLLDRAG